MPTYISLLFIALVTALDGRGVFAKFNTLPHRFVFAVVPLLITIVALRFSGTRDFIVRSRGLAD